MKKILTEREKNKIISDKEKVIIESFAKTYNRIKRIDENEITENQLLEEGWKEWLAAGLITLSTVGGVYKFNQDKIKTEKAGKELVQNATSILDKMSNEEKVELIQSLVDKGHVDQLQSGLHLVGAPMSKSEYGDDYVKNKASHDRADSSYMNDNLKTWMQKYPGWFGITKDGKIAII